MIASTRCVPLHIRESNEKDVEICFWEEDSPWCAFPSYKQASVCVCESAEADASWSGCLKAQATNRSPVAVVVAAPVGVVPASEQTMFCRSAGTGTSARLRR